MFEVRDPGSEIQKKSSRIPDLWGKTSTGSWIQIRNTDSLLASFHVAFFGFFGSFRNRSICFGCFETG
jgi:hypothetical protein